MTYIFSSAIKTKLAFAVLTLLLALTACSESPERIEHNNPDKYAVAQDVLWASPDGLDLTMDIYTPNQDSTPRPVIVMFHGGGWLINDNSIMDQGAAYLATNGRYVVCNVNYRLLGDNDNSVTLNQIAEDAFGAVLWVKENISRYGGDPTQVIVTGDSAGGHLSAMIVNSGDKLSTLGFSGHGFARQAIGFKPTYLPPGKSAEDVADASGLEVQAAILSYGAFDLHNSALEGFESFANPFWLFGGVMARGLFGDNFNVTENPDLYRALSPVHNIPYAAQRKLPPQLLTVGSEDSLVTPDSVQEYAGKLVAAGHPVEYWEYPDKSHAFLDSGSNRLLGRDFSQNGPPALDVMLRFLDSIFFQ